MWVRLPPLAQYLQGVALANMLGKHAQQKYGYGSRRCQCCSIDRDAPQKRKRAIRFAERKMWQNEDHDEEYTAEENHQWWLHWESLENELG